MCLKIRVITSVNVALLHNLCAVRPLSKEITMSQAYQNMCAGMYKVQQRHPSLDSAQFVSQ